VGIDHYGLTVLSEFPAANALSRCAHGYPREDARAPTLSAGLAVHLCLSHVLLISCLPADLESTSLAAEGA